MIREERKSVIARKAQRLRELADKMKTTRDSSTALYIARDIRETSRELRELTCTPTSHRTGKRT